MLEIAWLAEEELALWGLSSVGLHSSALNIISKYSIWAIDSVVMKGAVWAAEVIYSTECDPRVAIICGYLRSWKEVAVADFRVLFSLGSLR